MNIDRENGSPVIRQAVMILESSDQVVDLV